MGMAEDFAGRCLARPGAVMGLLANNQRTATVAEDQRAPVETHRDGLWLREREVRGCDTGIAADVGSGRHLDLGV